MNRIHLVEGPVGAGKSTYAAALSAGRRAPHFNLDDWFVTLYSPDRPRDGVLPWYAQRKQRCIAQIWKVASATLHAGVDVVLELGLLTRAERTAFYERADLQGFRLAVTVLDAPREVRRERVRRRNQERGDTFRMEVPEAIFELASDRWEPPDAGEIRERHVTVLDTGGTNGIAGYWSND